MTRLHKPSFLAATLLLVLTVAAAIPSPARADTLLSVDAANVKLGADTLNIAMQLDVTTLSVLPGSSATFTGSLAGTLFNLAPICTNSGDCTCGAPLCSAFFSSTDAIFNFTDASGDLIQLGDENSNPFQPILFPAVGTYSSSIVSVTCARGADTCVTNVGVGTSSPSSGTVTVAQIPEPAELTLLITGFLSLFLFGYALRKRPVVVREAIARS